MLEIVIDSRELHSPVHQILAATPNINLTVKELSSGDYVLGDGFAIERKDATDFVLSIMDGRLFSQVLRMKVEYDRVVFLIHGNVYATRSAITPDSIRGAISYLMAIEGVSVVTTGNAIEAADLMLTMTRHLQEGLGYDVPLRSSKPKDLRDLASYLVQGLPGIGATSARGLLAHFGSPARVFAATAADLCKAPGVGKKTAERIFEALHTGE